MVQWLNDWLKQIILIILLAAFLDLLLPNGVLQRYVKVIVSMFILLTLLSPLLHIFRSPLPTEELILPNHSNLNAVSIATLEEVIEDGEKLREAQEENSRDVASEQAAEWLQIELHKTFPERSFPHVELELAGEALEWEIAHVYIQVGEREMSDDAYDQNRGIDDIAPVMIDVTMDPISKAPQVPQAEHKEEDRSFIQSLHAVLRSWLEVKPEQITLEFVERG